MLATLVNGLFTWRMGENSYMKTLEVNTACDLSQVRSSMEEYASLPWLLDYWQSHGEEMDLTVRAWKNHVLLSARDESFQWEQTGHGDEVAIPASAETIKIGYNNSDNAKRFDFSSEKKPVLCVAPGEKKADLENIPAIRRTHSPA